MKSLLSVVIIFGVVTLSGMLIPGAFGHGIGYEVLPPVQLGDKMVALEVTSSQYENPDNPDREIQFSLFNVEDTITIRDVTYHIEATKGDRFLFDETFATTDGIFVFVLEGDDSDEITITKEDQSSFFESIVGLKKEIIHVKGSPFKTGGLYKFKVEITTAESFSNKLEPPIEYDVGLSIPERTFFDVQDPNFGTQSISVVTYYDEIYDFKYDPNSREISFSMPFEWEINNINETSVIHEELTFRKAFGDLLVSQYTSIVNDLEMPERVVTIDEFSENQRIVHIVLNQNDLRGILENQKQNNNDMRFSLAPIDDAKLSTVTGNGQFRITVDWEPKDIRSNSEITFLFDITDVFLKNKPVAVDYELSLVQNGNVIGNTNGRSSDIKEEKNEFTVFIPEGISGPVTLQFDNLNGNSLARVGLPIVVDRISVEEEISIPDWVRNNAEWWAEGQINDSDFALGIEYMIKQKIIVVPISDASQDTGDVSIPDWVRNNAEWWAEGIISDKDFANGIQYLVSKGIISV